MAASESLVSLLVGEGPIHVEPQSLCGNVRVEEEWPVFNLFINYTK